MTEALRTFLNNQADELDRDVQTALESCGGNAMSALRVLVIANTFLMEENELLKSQVSTGYARTGSPNKKLTPKE